MLPISVPSRGSFLLRRKVEREGDLRVTLCWCCLCAVRSPFLLFLVFLSGYRQEHDRAVFFCFYFLVFFLNLDIVESEMKTPINTW